MEESQEHPPLVSNPPSQQGTAGPSGPLRPPGLGSQSAWEVGCFPNCPTCRLPSRGNSAGFSHQMTGNAMEGYSASNYYFEKGGKKNAERETVPTQIISLGGWEAVSRKRHFEKPSINLTSNYLLNCWYTSPSSPPGPAGVPPRKTRAPH